MRRNSGLAIGSALLAVVMLATGAAAQERHRIEIVPSVPHADAWISIKSAAFSPDGALVLTGSRDATVKLWDVATRRLIRTFVGHAADIAAVAYLQADGTRVLSAGRDGTLKLWDAATGRLALTINAHPGPTSSRQISRGVLSRRRTPAIRLATGRARPSCGRRRPGGSMSDLSRPQWKPRQHHGGRVLARRHPRADRRPWRQDSKTVGQGDGAGRADVRRRPQQYAVALAFSPDGGRVLTGDIGSLCIEVVGRGDGIADPHLRATIL